MDMKNLNIVSSSQKDMSQTYGIISQIVDTISTARQTFLAHIFTFCHDLPWLQHHTSSNILLPLLLPLYMVTWEYIMSMGKWF